MSWALFVAFLAFCAVFIFVSGLMLGLAVGTWNTAAEAARMADDIEHGRRITP